MAAIIELREVSFAYGQTESLALKDLNLTIEEGGFVGVIGPSGAGKSTLASVLSGAIPHHYTGRLYGETRVAGLDTCEASLTDIATIVGSVLPVSYTHLDVYKRQAFARNSGGVPKHAPPYFALRCCSAATCRAWGFAGPTRASRTSGI